MFNPPTSEIWYIEIVTFAVSLVLYIRDTFSNYQNTTLRVPHTYTAVAKCWGSLDTEVLMSIHPTSAACIGQTCTCYKHSLVCTHLCKQLPQEDNSHQQVFWSPKCHFFCQFWKVSLPRPHVPECEVTILHILL